MASAGLASSSNVLVLAKKSDSGSSGSGSDNNGGSSSTGSSDSGSGSGSSDNNDGSGGSQGQTQTPEAKPSEVNKPDNNISPPIDDKSGGVACADNCDANGHNVPIMPTMPLDKNKAPIDFNCHFHPEKCVPDVPGQCPGGFASNDNGNCHPVGPCPPGFGRHDNDESGKCFRNGDPINFCHFPSVHCNTIVKIIHTHSSSGSSDSGSSHSLSAKCFDAIKIAWIGKIHRGENHDVDKIIDKCLGV